MQDDENRETSAGTPVDQSTEPLAGDEEAAVQGQDQGAVEGDEKPTDEVDDARGVVKSAEDNADETGDGTAVRKFRVIGEGPLDVKGQEFQPGEWVELSDAEAAPFVSRGRVEAYDTVAGDAPVPTKPEPGAPAPEQKDGENDEETA